MFKKSVPDWLVGVWKRLSIEENNQKDTTTQVLWIQTNSCFGDIRIPADRPVLAPTVQSLEDLSHAQAIALSHQSGFAGITRFQPSADGDICQWHRALDYQPFKGQFDIGRIHRQGDILIETGMNGSYTEEWQRIATGPTAALTLLDDSVVDSSVVDSSVMNRPVRQAWLVICGDRFMYSCDRRPSLPAAQSLTELLEAPIEGRARPSNRQYLNCEISLGNCQTGIVPWEIQNSTLPWQIGRSLWQNRELILDAPHNRLIQSNKHNNTIWTVQEWGHLAQLL